MRRAMLVEVNDGAVLHSVAASDGSFSVAVEGEHSMASMRVIAALREELDRMRGRPSERPRCATCKWAADGEKPWWLTEGDESEIAARMINARDSRYLTFPLRCNLAEFDEDTDRDASRMCVTMDGSDYKGELWVKPDFGCVQWEGRV